MALIAIIASESAFSLFSAVFSFFLLLSAFQIDLYFSHSYLRHPLCMLFAFFSFFSCESAVAFAFISRIKFHVSDFKFRFFIPFIPFIPVNVFRCYFANRNSQIANHSLTSPKPSSLSPRGAGSPQPAPNRASQNTARSLILQHSTQLHAVPPVSVLYATP